MGKTLRGYFILLIFILVGIFGAMAFAVPSANVSFELSQPNGEKFKAAVHGDEKYNWTTAETGEVIVQDDDKYWKYAKKIEGKLEPTNIKYSKSGQKPVTTIKDKDIIVQIKKDTIIPNSPKISSSATSQDSQTGTTSEIMQSGSTSNTEKILVLLVQFSNIGMKYSEAEWSNSFFGATGSTVSSYYKEVSNSKFTFVPASETSGTANDGVIKVTLSYNHPNTGGNIGSANQKIVSDALTAANPYINYASFDTNGDGTVSPNELHILVVVAGYETAYGGGSYPSVWAHSWSTQVTLDGKYMYKYTQQGEIHYDHMATIGTACHELGHDLGLPDLYDYDYSSAGVGIHSLMAGGSWAYYNGYPGNSPTHLDAWSKVKLGYVTPTEVSGLGSVTVKSFDTNQYNVFKVPTQNQSEYFLIENRQKQGFDKGLARYVNKYGIAIWHVDDSIIANFYRINDNESHKGVDLEEANEGALGYSQLDKNYGGTYDHYYSSSNTTTFGPSTTPNSKLYDGTDTKITISVQDVSSNSMTVNLVNAGTETPPKITNVSASPEPFAPNGSNYETISYTLSKDSYVTVKILDEYGITKRILQNNELVTSGAYSVIWDGKDSYGAIVRDAIYTYTIIAVDKVGLYAVPFNGKITVETGKPIISDVSDNPDPYSGAANTYCQIKYSVSEFVNLNLKIYDSSNNLVRTVFDGQVGGGPGTQFTVDWNGKDSDGKSCRNGIYKYKINATDRVNNAADEAIGTITIDRGAPVALTLYGHKPDPMKSYARITYGITQPAYVTLKIYDSSNNIVRTLLNSRKMSAGTHYINWTGRNNSGAAVTSGYYKYTIEAEDLNGNTSNLLTDNITVDRTGPDITNLAVSNSVFTPNGANTNTISYNLSEDCKVNLNVFNSNNQLVRTFLNKTSQTKGANSAVWDGKNRYDEFVQDGTYIVKASAYDSLGNRSTTKAQTIVIDKNPPSIDDVSDSPDPFGIGNGQVSTIKCTLSENAYVNISIFNSSNALVKTLFDGNLLKGEQCATWDGKDNSGLAVENGIYLYKINANDIVGNKAIEQLGAITTDKNPVTITNVSTSPSEFNPSGVITYTISKNANVTISILDNSNNVLRTVENGTSLYAGVNTTVWDGKDNNGNLVSSGTYKFKITAVDAVGFNAVPYQGTIIIVIPDTTAPIITNINDLPDPLKLGANGAASTIRFTISENALVTIKIYDANNKLVRNLLNTSVAFGDYSCEFDGKDDAGALVADGTYVYVISATDQAGNASSQEVGTVTTDKTPISITNVSTSPDKFAISGVINYTISEKGVVSIAIYDDKNNLVNTIIDAGQMNAGDNTSTWDGKDSNGLEVQSGNYSYIITAVDNVGFMATYKGTMTVDGMPPVISDLSSNPDVLIPMGANITSISYTISSNAYVTIKVFDSNQKLVKTLQNGILALRGQNSIGWNGTNDGGAVVSDGVYTYKISGVDSVGKVSNEALGTITVDKTPPQISNTSVNPNIFGASSYTTISYTLSEKASVTIKILSSEGNTVRLLEDNISKYSGSNKAVWDGKDNNGSSIIGTFSYEITAVDIAQFSTTVKGTITVADDSTPEITEVGSSPNPFSANGTNTMNITYTLSKDAKVTVKIFNCDNNLVKTLISDTSKLKGQNNTWWDGKNSTGSLVQEGVYTYKISIVDILGKSAEAVGTAIVGTPPIISQDGVSNNPFIVNGTNVENIAYNLSKNANVTIKILDSQNTLVKVLYSGVNNSGNNSVNWDGTVDGKAVEDGSYQYLIQAIDSIGLKGTATKNFIVISSTLSITNVSHSPEPFKADGSLASINYNISRNSLVTIEVFDKNNSKIKKVCDNFAQNEGDNVAYWDGKDEGGNTVIDGIYTFKITAFCQITNQSTAAQGTITVKKDTAAGEIKDISVNPNPYSVTLGTDAVISYTLTAEATVSIVITDQDDNTVRALEDSIIKSAGEYTVNWDGKDDSTSVGDGVYYVKITAVNGGGIGNTYKKSFRVESFNPIVNVVKDGPNPFKPNNIDLWSVEFNLSEDANVYLEIKNSSNSIVWTARPVVFTKGTKTIELYGTNDSGQLLNDGIYNYRLCAVDFAGKNSIDVLGNITIDKTPPVITKASAALNAFSKETVISYNISEKANVNIAIYNGDTLIRMILEDVLQNAGDNSCTWDSTDSEGNIVEDGIYTFKITATDSVGLTSQKSGTVTKDTGKPIVSNVSDTIDPFIPSGSNYTTINFGLSKNAYVDLIIYDKNGAVSRKLLTKYPAIKGANFITWDGKNDNGTILQDGIYIYRINAIDILGNSAIQVGGTITIDKIAPVISNFIANPYPFSPDGTSKVTLSYNLSEYAYITAIIIDNSANELAILDDNVLRSSGEVSVSWDGTSSGIIVEDNTYRLKINALDLAGNSTEYYGWLGIDRFEPTLTAIDDNPDPFNYKADDFCTIHAQSSEWMKSFTADLYDSNNALVKGIDTELTNEFWWGWSGANADGNFVSDGAYTYKVNGSDLFGKVLKEGTGNITVDTTTIEINDVCFIPELENPSGTIRYTLSKDAKVSIDIYDISNNLISSIETDVQKNTGSNTAFWDGKQDGKYIGYGVYIYKIDAVALNGAKALPATGIITFETIDPDYVDEIIEDNEGIDFTNVNKLTPTQTSTLGEMYIGEVSDGPDLLNIASLGAMSTINFKISKDALVTIIAYDSNKNPVKTITNQYYYSGYNTVTWSGKNSSGSNVNDGLYTYEITAVDKDDNYAKPVTGTIYVVYNTSTANSSGNTDNSQSSSGIMPIISGVDTSPDKFTPSGTITYKISKPAKVTLTIYDRALNVVEVLENNIQKNAGQYSVTWDGYDKDGLQVDDIVYTFKITAVDMQGLWAQPVTDTIYVKPAEFNLSIISANPNPYRPIGVGGGHNALTIAYSLTMNAKITAGIYTSDGVLIKTLCRDLVVNEGTNTITWLGVNNDNVTVSQGGYTCKIIATSSSGRQINQSISVNVQ